MVDIPKPGQPVRGSDSGQPIMALLDLLGRRWTLRLIWELRTEPLTFRELQSRCAAMSSSVLSQRMAEMRAAGIAEASGTGYRLTEEGRLLLELYPPVQAWAERWAQRERSRGGGDDVRPAGQERRRARNAEGPGKRGLRERAREDSNL